MLLHPLVLLSALPAMATAKYLMYLTEAHDNVSAPSTISEVTHVALAFMNSSHFNRPEPTDWPFFTTVDKARSQFAKGTSVLVSIGGWGNTQGFSAAAVNQTTRCQFARNVKAMLDYTGADGVDVDWEYPGGNGDDYKQVPNSQKVGEVEAYPELLAEIRKEIGVEKLMTAAVPGSRRDMIAFTKKTVPKINEQVDFLNIMTYDLMTRRDNITKHHTGIALSLDAIDAYLENGLPPHKALLGFAFYLKWFKTDPKGGCDQNPIGCKTVLMEDPINGTDLGQSGAFSWNDTVPAKVSSSYQRAMAGGEYDPKGGGHYFWDRQDQIWWSWDTPEVIFNKFPDIVEKKNLGGVFAWALGEDGPEFAHLKALSEAYSQWPLLRGQKKYSSSKTEL